MLVTDSCREYRKSYLHVSNLFFPFKKADMQPIYLFFLFVTSYCQLVRVIPDPAVNPNYCTATGCCDVLNVPVNGIIANAVAFSPSNKSKLVIIQLRHSAVFCNDMNTTQVAFFNSLRQFR